MNPARPLVRIRHGSHLYGTNTPTSDLDYKGVFLPAGADILLQCVPTHIDAGTKDPQATHKNTPDDIDDTSYPLQKFFGMIAAGDTVGTEILFAPDDAIVAKDDELWPLIVENKDMLLNRECKGFVGYCQKQAAKYGVKGSRMAACKDIVDLLKVAAAGDRGMNTKLAEISELLYEFCTEHEFSEIVNIPAPSGKDIFHLEVIGRKIPFTNTVKQALDVYEKVYENYGHRARAAMNNEGIDWKAMSHAVRVGGQALELLSTGHITFPRPEADYLLAVKRGELDYQEVAAVLEGIVEDVEEEATTSWLPETADWDSINEFVLRLHFKQVI